MSVEPESSAPLVAALDLHKSYSLGRRSLEVLRGVSLELSPKSFVAIRGASGAGKSTLLHLLGGLDAPTSGQIRFQGEDISRMGRNRLNEFRRCRIGFVFQAYHLMPELSALENVCLPARIARRDARETEERGTVLLRRVGLEARLDHRPYELSGGEQQRVAIARALINDPVLLLADEPTGNLDSHTGEEIIGLLCALREESSMTLVLATHDTQVAARAEGVVELADGEISPLARSQE